MLFSGCKSTQSISSRNVNYLYRNADNVKLDVDYHLFKQSENQILLIWRVNPESFAPNKSKNVEEFIDFTIRYKIYNNYSEELAIDSGIVVMKEQNKNKSNFFLDTIKITLSESRRYVLDIICKDLNSLRSKQQLLDLDNSQTFNHHSAILYDLNGELSFSPVVCALDTYRVKLSTKQNRLFVKHYQRNFQVAAAPFAVIEPKPFNFKPDRFFDISINADGYFYLPISTEGFYKIVEDSTKLIGPTIYYFNDHFPESKTVNDLLYPLRYITTAEEYRGFLSGNSVKKNVDSFWLKTGGNQARAKELIKAYYSRVQQTNILFTSYIEGWKTDRGMCYLIYGEPNYVYKNTASETWIYGEEGVYNSLSLTFTKVANPFATNDFRLNRSNTLKPSWYRSVEFWRQGRVITYQ